MKPRWKDVGPVLANQPDMYFDLGDPGSLQAFVNRAPRQSSFEGIDAVTDGVCMLDANGMVYRCNGALASLLGKPVRELVGLRVEELLGSRLGSALSQMREGRLRQHVEVPWAKTSLHVTLDPLPDEDGDFAGAVAMVIDDAVEAGDLSDRLGVDAGSGTAEQELTEVCLAEESDRLASRIEYDFGNLLSTLLTYPEMIKERLPEAHPTVEYCDAMLAIISKMVDMNEKLIALRYSDFCS